MSTPVTAASARVVTKRLHFRLGAFEYSMERDERTLSYAVPALPSAAPVKSRRSVVGLTLAGTAAIALATVTALGFGTGAEAGGVRYKVAIAVPAPIERSTRRAGVGKAAVKRSVAPAPVASRDLDRVDGDGSGSKELPDDAAEPVILGREQAIQAALTTGRLQQWSGEAGDEAGFVVVGDYQADNQKCRNLSVLTKRDAESQVDQVRGCLVAGKSRTWLTSPRGSD